MARYAISDIHGCYKAFMSLLEQIHFSEEDTLYILGDMIDRGPDSKKVVDYIRAHENIIPIMGNHEWMLLEYMDNGMYADAWMHNGSFEMRHFLETAEAEVANDYIQWFASLPYWIELEDCLLIHAGWHVAMRRSLIKQYQTLDAFLSDIPKMELIWSRFEFIDHPLDLSSLKDNDYKVVFGHTQTYHMTKCRHDEAAVWLDHNKIDIDCGAAYGGRLACMNLDTLEVIYATEPDLKKKTRRLNA